MVDYGFYAGTYGGSSIPAAAFDGYIRAADAHLERYRQIYTLSPGGRTAKKWPSAPWPTPCIISTLCKTAALRPA